MKLRLPAIGFRGRLLAAMLTLALVTSLAIAAAFMLSTFEEEQERAREQLDVAGEVVQEILQRRAQLLVNTLSVLVEDFGFKSAIATREPATITSVLENHSQRFNADLAMIIDREGNLLANLHGLVNQNRLPFDRLLQQANRHGVAADLVTLQNQAYQALMVPVQAPGLRVWLVMGFSLDDEFAGIISRLTGVDVVFQSTRLHGANKTQAASGKQGLTRFYGRTLGDGDLTPIAGDSQKTTSDSGMIGDRRYFARTAPLGKEGEAPVEALLLLDRQQALADYYRLALDLILLVLACLALAGLLALGMARALGRPVLKLTQFAGQIGEGKDPIPPGLKSRDELGKLERVLVNSVRQIRHREHRIQHEATHDSLTGLPNRSAMDAYLKTVLEQRVPGFLISLTVIGLKELSETLGYEIGDQALIATGLRLRGTVGAENMLARTGGNEFMTFLPGTDEDRLQDAIIVLKARAEESMQLDQTPLAVELSATILQLPEHARSLDDIRRRLSLTREKAAKDETRMAFYVEGGEERHLRELKIIQDLHQAIAQGQLTMVYQPKIRLDTATVVQVEALVRWQHPQLGFINPEEFISLAERSGQIHQLTEHILRQVELDGRAWQAAGMPGIGVAINLSALDLANQALPTIIEMIFADWPRPLEMLTFEITEGAAMTDTQAAVRTLGNLRQLGVKLSVDDFGTGYSSLAQMRQLPVQELKIDKSFVLRLDSTPQDQLIVKSTVDMAHGLGLSVVAEGIENEESWRLLQSWGCELAQGFFLGRPMSPEQLIDWYGTFDQRSESLADQRQRA
ncbi:bifunctional diguanylate cyclase/phosphodiesterase [Marinobacter nanhaiticus D15-8W]|uniref:EAL domain-containing protein n=1 Tax=Marinobacter nanhaiticus D15-8W TaxID=626887 RepID=N6X2J7_9GAMM|nr:EAL domain-containing protein [Marinobacter nanhaiticus]ENO15283.1 EAL domain-containing protein [Marinobacter nanhaiticus D15-8W]BES69014.1 bifunctional diguanylate cyclase/phosphodiesterase [Marinobacter nanhaiticus D15-8W]